MPQRPRPCHAGKAANAGAANDAVQNRLGLIVGRMGSGDEPGAEPSGGLFEEAVSRRACGGFEAVTGRQPSDIDMAHLAGHAQPAAQIDHETFVFVGVGAEMMVQMGGAKAAFAPAFQSRHRPQQSHAIAPARNGHKHRHVAPGRGRPCCGQSRFEWI